MVFFFHMDVAVFLPSTDYFLRHSAVKRRGPRIRFLFPTLTRNVFLKSTFLSISAPSGGRRGCTQKCTSTLFPKPAVQVGDSNGTEIVKYQKNCSLRKIWRCTLKHHVFIMFNVHCDDKIKSCCIFMLQISLKLHVSKSIHQ